MFKLYRFSPIKNEAELMEAIEYLHYACFKLCMQALGAYLPIAGNVGIFCHYDDEYTNLIQFRSKLTEPSDNPKQKYFKLHQPIIISAKDSIPETIYTHLCIRKPDPYRAQIGDIDFIMPADKYASIRGSLQNGETIHGARIFDRPELDMIELYDFDIDALGYVCTQQVTVEVRKN